MTLIIGIKCQDAIVMGADRGATMGTVAGIPTVMQRMKKLNVINGRTIAGVSGPVGLGQLYADKVEKVCKDALTCDTPEICRKLRNEFIQDAQVAFQMATIATPVVGQQARSSAIATALVSVATKDGPNLIEFDSQCNPEIKTDDLPFVSIGSGQPTADPFLAFIQKMFWSKRMPSIAEGCFAAVWTLQHAINITPGGIADPIDLAVLEIRDSQPIARLLSDAKLLEHKENVSELEKYIGKFPEQQIPASGQPEPPPPPKFRIV